MSRSRDCERDRARDCGRAPGDGDLLPRRVTCIAAAAAAAAVASWSFCGPGVPLAAAATLKLRARAAGGGPGQPAGAACCLEAPEGAVTAALAALRPPPAACCSCCCATSATAPASIHCGQARRAEQAAHTGWAQCGETRRRRARRLQRRAAHLALRSAGALLHCGCQRLGVAWRRRPPLGGQSARDGLAPSLPRGPSSGAGPGGHSAAQRASG